MLIQINKIEGRQKTGGLCATLHPPLWLQINIEFNVTQKLLKYLPLAAFRLATHSHSKRNNNQSVKKCVLGKVCAEVTSKCRNAASQFYFSLHEKFNDDFFVWKKQKMRYFRDAIYSRMACPMQDFQRFDVFVKKQKMKISCSKEKTTNFISWIFKIVDKAFVVRTVFHFFSLYYCYYHPIEIWSTN